MFYDHSQHAARRDPAAGGWVHSHLTYETVMSTLVAMIVVWVAAVLFLPLWIR